jgi:hypothetical protein
MLCLPSLPQQGLLRAAGCSSRFYRIAGFLLKTPTDPTDTGW